MAETAALKVDAVQVVVVRPLLIAVSGVVNPSLLFVYVYYSSNRKRAVRQPPNKVAVKVVEIEVVPTVTFRHPNKLLTVWHPGE